MKPTRLQINLASTWLAHAVALAVAFFLMPYVLHTLGDAAYGTWIFINAAAGYSGLLYLGFGQTICRYVADAHARHDWGKLNRVVNVVLAAYLCLGGFALVVAAVLAWLAPLVYDWGRQSLFEVRLVILILGVNTALGMTGSVFGGVLSGIQRFDLDRSINVVAGLLRFVLTVVFLQSQWGLLTLACIFLAVTVVENFGHLLLAFVNVKTLSLGVRHIDRETIRECFSFSFYAFLDAVAYQLIDLSDTVIVGFVLGAKATVPYYIALRLCKFIGKPIHYIGHVVMPRAGELHSSADRRGLRELVAKGAGLALLLTVGFFIGAGFFGRTLIGAWVGPGYERSHLLLLVLLGAQIVATPMEVIRSALFGMGHVRFPALMYIVEAAANLTLSLVLIRPFGLMGVAVATAVPLVAIELGALLPYAMRILKFDIGQLIRRGFGPQLLPLVLLLGYSFLVSAFVPDLTGWLPLTAVALGGGTVLAAGWLANESLLRGLRIWIARDAQTAG